MKPFFIYKYDRELINKKAEFMETEDSRNPYECEFTRVAIESMIPEAEYIDEDEPDVS